MFDRSLRASRRREISHACWEGCIELFGTAGAVGAALAWALWKSALDESCAVYETRIRVEPNSDDGTGRRVVRFGDQVVRR